MRTLLFSIALLLSVGITYGQRNQKADPKDLQIDSLKQATAALTVQLDSVSGELVKYVGVYNAIKENVLFYDFDPTRAAYLIDSLKAARDSSFLLIGEVPDSAAIAKATATADSILLLINENTALKSTIDSLKTAWDTEKTALTKEEIEKAKAIDALIQLKGLFDDKIITEAEFISLKQKYLIKL